MFLLERKSEKATDMRGVHDTLGVGMLLTNNNSGVCD